MELIRVLEALERYSEETVAYKLDAPFACAVSEAVSLLQGMGEQLADAQIELERMQESDRWIPVTEEYPELYKSVLVCACGPLTKRSFPVVSEMVEENGKRWTACPGFEVTHWMPVPELPKGGS